MKKIPVIFDVDTGLDDSMALFAGVNDPRFETLAVTATYGNTTLENSLRNTLNALHLLGRPDVPVGKGACQGFRCQRHTSPLIHGESGIGTFVYPEDSRENLSLLPAWDLIAERCFSSEEKVTVFVLGPCTNAAMAVLKYPDLKEKIGRFVFMGGGIRIGAAGQCASVNVYHDPEAFGVLIHSGIPFYMFTSEQFTDSLHITPNEAKEVFAEGDELCQTVYHMLKDYHRSSTAFDGKAPDPDRPVVLHDPACVMAMLDETLYEPVKLFCGIELKGTYTYGMTVIDVNDRLHKSDEEKNIFLACAKEGVEEKMKQMFISCILNAGGKHEQI
ncbi:MAG: nucleoside hydrolase [Erysipelotrichaceae bacterium]|nr:nucleoside hydrolase [Erysipelotrichaceae bacterium]